MAAPTALHRLRGTRERALQTLWFEGLGLMLVAPAHAWVTGTAQAQSLAMLAAVSLAVMLWSALYNAAFDHVEHRASGRVASDRPHRWRTLHAVGLELGATVVTLPLIWALTEHGWLGALAVDLGLGITYAVYGYVFHLAFDRLRPCARCEAPQLSRQQRRPREDERRASPHRAAPTLSRR